MSLQGTLDTFALPDVLRLLAATRKTGHLRLDGSRGYGNVWVDGGAVMAADASNVGSGGEPVDVVFELLRFRDGAFCFDAGVTTSKGGAPVDVEPLLFSAEGLLTEWREIEAVVPSLEAWLTLVPELPEPVVSIAANQWRLLVVVGGGSTVDALAKTLSLGELDVSRAIKGLVEAGLVTVTDAPVSGSAGPASGLAGPAEAAASELGELALVAETSAMPDVPEPARQLAALGPGAARAVAAAASAETPEEREAALASLEGTEGDESINRGPLPLSSVRT